VAETTLVDLLAAAQAIVGEGRPCVRLVLWRLGRARPEDASARREMEEILSLGREPRRPDPGR
jgi:hypothetical protein